MLKIAFVDPLPLDYVVDTPRTRPLGGSQSSLCYLAETLARSGHTVVVYNGTRASVQSRGIRCEQLAGAHASEFSQYDAAIILNLAAPEMARRIRATGANTKVVLWSQHLPDQPAVRTLADGGTHDAWDAVVVCSEYMATGYRQVFRIDPGKIKILGNAISPTFENLYANVQEIAERKPWPPVLCYTSTPFRGLDVLLEAFPSIRRSIPGTTLRVYSSMSVYGVLAQNDTFAFLYDQCRRTEGVEYVGSLSQTRLARELAGMTCLAYPNTFVEGYCISVVEALAAGLIVITSDLGALREATAGHAHLMEPPSDKREHAARYADFAASVLQRFHASPDEYASRIEEQVIAVNRASTWAARARDWGAWLGSLISR